MDKKHLPCTQAAGVLTWKQPKFIVLLSSQVPPPCAFSLTMPVVMCSSINTCHGGGKKERNCGKILAASSVRWNTDIRAMDGRKGFLKILAFSAPISVKVDPSRLRVNVGDVASVSCRINGFPIRRIRWIRNGKIVFAEAAAAAAETEDRTKRSQEIEGESPIELKPISWPKVERKILLNLREIYSYLRKHGELFQLKFIEILRGGGVFLRTFASLIWPLELIAFS